MLLAATRHMSSGDAEPRPKPLAGHAFRCCVSSGSGTDCPTVLRGRGIDWRRTDHVRCAYGGLLQGNGGGLVLGPLATIVIPLALAGGAWIFVIVTAGALLRSAREAQAGALRSS
jgi:hypothetical protein